MLTFAISLVIMLVVVGAAVQWAVRVDRRNLERGADARDH
jgi:putative effector of murein hydrolase LrgA (UPF0299 family)